jgi:lysophospholipase L1-like esterase
MSKRTVRVALSWRKKALFGAFTTVLVLAVLELAAHGLFWVRSLGKPVPSDPVINRFHPLRYELRPGGSVPANGMIAQINRDGLRGSEARFERVRVLCLGDSCTFGYAPDVTDDQTYPAWLDRLLEQTQPGKFTVLNGGMPGFSSLDALAFMDFRGPELIPDMVVIMVGWNDAKLCHPIVRPDVTPVSAPLEASALFQLGKILLTKVRGPARFDARAVRAALERRPEPSVRLSEIVFRRYLRTLQDIVFLTRARGAVPVLVSLPNFTRLDWKDVDSLTDIELERAGPYLATGHLTAEGWSRFIAATNVEIESVAGAMKVPIVDGAGLKDPVLFVDLCHLNAAGNEALARRVAPIVLKADENRRTKDQEQRGEGP